MKIVGCNPADRAWTSWPGLERHHPRIGVVLVFVLLLCVGPARSTETENAHYNVVVALYQAGQWQAALNKIAEREQGALDSAQRARYLYARGLVYEASSRPDPARQAYRTLIEKHADSAEAVPARLALVYLDYQAGHYEAVAGHYESLPRAGLAREQQRDLALMAAEAATVLGDAERAVKLFDQALHHGAEAASVHPRLFDLHLAAGRHAEVLRFSEQGLPGRDPATLAVMRAEAQLALGRFAAVAVEVAKVPSGHALYPRACYSRARALIALNQAAAAAEPLAEAVRSMADLPSPVAARVALADCWLEAGETDRARQVLKDARGRLSSVPAADRSDLHYRILLLDLRLARELDDPLALAVMIDQARGVIPVERLPELLYRRLSLLAQSGRARDVLAAYRTDAPHWAGSEWAGTAALLTYRCLADDGQTAVAQDVLESYLADHPDTPDGFRARLELARLALAADAASLAAGHLDALLGDRRGRAAIGSVATAQALLNRGLLYHRAGETADAIRLLTEALAAGLEPASVLTARKALGQAQADGGDPAAAAATWKPLWPPAAGADDPELGRNLLLVLFLSGQDGAAAAQARALADAAGGAEALDRESLELWARSLYRMGDAAGAAGLFERIFQRFKTPDSAYECAVALDRAGDAAAAVVWYRRAAETRGTLSPEYRAGLPALIAQAEAAAGIPPGGADYWVTQLGVETDEPVFAAAVQALARAALNDWLTVRHLKALDAALAGYPAEHSRRLSAAVASLAAAARLDTANLLARTETLAAAYAAAAGGLPPGSPAATVAPATIHFYRGEALRAAGQPAAALADYETVLAVYPYNEWPDAASVGAAAAFAALGDSATAVARLQDVIDNGGGHPRSAPWLTLARQRLTELNPGTSP